MRNNPATALTIDPAIQKNIDLWLTGHYDEETKRTIRKLQTTHPKELVDAFYKTLAFGTGGMRGIMGVGTNRMNQYTVAAATQGLANTLRKAKPNKTLKVFLGYDSRHHSRSFAEESAKVLAGNGIQVFLTKEICPTPLVSFGCRHLHCDAAIMITASHNPAEYNGYKVYWDDGAQVLPPHDKDIIAEFNAITDVTMVKKADTIHNPLIKEVGKELYKAYLQAIAPLQNYGEECQKEGKRLKVVYTSLHGTGIVIMPEALTSWGFTNFVLVDEQITQDGSFPTVKTPNPEYPEALSLGIKKLKEVDADLLIATDPDADRIAVAVKHHQQVELLNGNQVACICLSHLCEALSAKNKLPRNAAFIKTIGTTELFKAIADHYQKPCFNVLTGFKYIAEMIRNWEKDPKGYQYVFGGEESFGYLYGTQVRDKDAILSGLVICEAALHAKRQGKTLIDLLHDLYRKYGVFYEELLSIDFADSKEGSEQMSSGMSKLRNSPPREIGGIQVVAIEDYLTSQRSDLKTNKKTAITLPKSDVLLFWLEDDSKVMIRPSGTEPKVKLYCGVVNREKIPIPKAIQECQKRAHRFLITLKSLLT